MDPFESPDMARHPASVDRDRRRTATDEADHTLRIYLIEDSPVIRENLIATLEETVPMRVVGTAEDEASAVHWLHEHPGPEECELVIIDIFLKSGSGLGVLAALSEMQPSSAPPAPERAGRLRCRRRLVVLSNFTNADIRQRCLRLGADRVFDKSREVEALIDYCDGLARAHPERH